MLPILQDFLDWFWQYYRYFWLLAIVAIPYLNHRSKQDDFSMLDGCIMYATVFIGVAGLIQNERQADPR